MPTIEEQYREHMHAYALNHMVLSFVAFGSKEFQALKAMGTSIIPFLLQDIQRTQEEWHESLRKRKNMYDSWAAIMLLRMAADQNKMQPPMIEKWMQGRHEPIRKAWLKWGKQHGFLPATLEEEKSESRALLWLRRVFGL